MQLSSSILGLLCATVSALGGDFTAKSLETPSYIEFSQARFEVSEAETNAVITVVRTGDYRRIAAVDYATRAVTATLDDDFRAAGGRLVFQAGQSFREIRVPIVQDQTAELDETFVVELSAPGPYTEIIGASAEVLIQDSAPLPVLEIAHAEGDLIISWPQTAAAYQLEFRNFMTTWENVAAAPEAGQDKWVVRVPATGVFNLFRLRLAQ